MGMFKKRIFGGYKPREVEAAVVQFEQEIKGHQEKQEQLDWQVHELKQQCADLQLDRDTLTEQNQALQEQNEGLEQRVQSLTEENKALRVEQLSVGKVMIQARAAADEIIAQANLDAEETTRKARAQARAIEAQAQEEIQQRQQAFDGHINTQMEQMGQCRLQLRTAEEMMRASMEQLRQIEQQLSQAKEQASQVVPSAGSVDGKDDAGEEETAAQLPQGKAFFTGAVWQPEHPDPEDLQVKSLQELCQDLGILPGDDKKLA